MKARVKATGETVNITHIGTKCYLYDLNNVEILNEPDYWEKLKHQYAGMAMQGMLSDKEMFNTIINGVYPPERPAYIAARCDDYATALVNRLKEEEK